MTTPAPTSLVPAPHCAQWGYVVQTTGPGDPHPLCVVGGPWGSLRQAVDWHYNLGGVLLVPGSAILLLKVLGVGWFGALAGGAVAFAALLKFHDKLQIDLPSMSFGG